MSHRGGTPPNHSMQLPVNFFSQGTADPLYLLEFVNAGSAYAFQATEPCQ